MGRFDCNYTLRDKVALLLIKKNKLFLDRENQMVRNYAHPNRENIHGFMICTSCYLSGINELLTICVIKFSIMVWMKVISRYAIC